ncbi:TPA: hypothetical protein ACN35C_004631 [Vibrio parahaemolyticus]
MTIRIDKGSIERAHKEYEEILKEEKMIPTIKQFISFQKIISEQIKPETPDAFAENCFDAVVSNIDSRSDFITDLWNGYIAEIKEVEKSKITLDKFYDYCLDNYSPESISIRKEECGFAKIKQAILEKIERAAGNNKQNWLALSKITMSAIKEKTESKVVKPKSTVSSKEDSPVSEKLASNQTTDLHNQERQNS